jgi:hypothetical protein
MPAVSQQQRGLMGMALAVKRGQIPASRIRPANRNVLEMSESQLRDYAATTKAAMRGRSRRTRARR